MHTRSFRLGIVTLLGVLLVVFLVALAALATPAPAHAADTVPHNTAADGGLDLRVRSRISIPYGIASPLMVTASGREIAVTGHGTCLDGATFDIVTMVTQEETGAVAIGRTSGDCPDTADVEGEWHWDATAMALAPVYSTFTAGDAHACAFAEVRADVDGTVTTLSKWWCKDVVLE